MKVIKFCLSGQHCKSEYFEDKFKVFKKLESLGKIKNLRIINMPHVPGESLSKEKIKELKEALNNPTMQWPMRGSNGRVNIKGGKPKLILIARKLGISVRTIPYYIDEIERKGNKRKNSTMKRKIRRIKKKSIRYCKECGLLINLIKQSTSIYCSKKCKIRHNSKVALKKYHANKMCQND